MRYLFTSESVTEGHPDKVCDQISDAILDAYLAADPAARVACEVTATTGIISIMGEITSTAHVDMEQIARDTLRRIGYTGDEAGFNCDTCAVVTSVHKQSPDIALGVDLSLEAKSGDALGGGACGAVRVDAAADDPVQRLVGRAVGGRGGPVGDRRKAVLRGAVRILCHLILPCDVQSFVFHVVSIIQIFVLVKG